ncbi:RNA methyltransferase [Ramlibacter alkalitolerans]|uniref:tRNA (cytidine/uridine-2'-O-)-methyltransferase TrmJ n=1 Tax=Ramlibacter alkalitolerans TaxID=2039631 RepID=A0ABS1JJC1_9BURK|nr:RNA methyltransferase [Ramlibacter alkalitolerans]MBL0424333.1 RNA methyltransferase [Ramlibacter alkalitolerans]
MSTRFVLIQPSHAGNVGAAARALKVMGFDDLVLVQPRWDDVLTRAETIERASGAVDVLQKARAVDSLDDALQGMTHVCATVMTARDFGPPTTTPREHLATVADRAERVAFLFGSERYGMRNEDVYRCHAALRIPVSPAYGSLNLASAIQVVAYEWRLALGGFEVPPPVAPAAADAAAVAGMLRHWEQALVEVGFLDPAAPRKLMPRLQQLFNRAQPTPEEIHILRGIAKSMSDMAKRAKA